MKDEGHKMKDCFGMKDKGHRMKDLLPSSLKFQSRRYLVFYPLSFILYQSYSLHPRVSETSRASLGVAQHFHLHHFGLLMSRDDHLADTLPGGNGLRLVAQVDKDNPHLSAVVGVNRPRAVQHGESALKCQAAARTNLRLVALRQFNEQTRRQQSPLHRQKGNLLAKVTPYIHSRRLRALIPRQRIIAFIDDFQLHIHCWIKDENRIASKTQLHIGCLFLTRLP